MLIKTKSSFPTSEMSLTH